ncbi:MAG: hypothetical protein ABIN18_20130 [Pseudomonadota bacterium]
MKTILLVLFGMAIVVYFLAKLVRSGGRITEYFSNAARVYVWLRDEDAKYAAIASAKTASSRQRELMCRYLDQLNSDLSPVIEEIPELTEISQLITQLEKEISSKDWAIGDIREAKEILGKWNSQYLEALCPFGKPA